MHGIWESKLLTILVINSKGGSGKTTLTTNLAAYYASRRFRTAIIDYDPQGSSLHWLQARPSTLPAIHAANGAPARGNAHLSSRQGWVPLDTEVLIVDAPAGASGLLLKDLVRKANFIVIPVAPSPIDIRATADFIKDLFLVGGARTSNARMAVVANRVRNRGSSIYAALERFLASLKLPFLASLTDSDVYLQSAGEGGGFSSWMHWSVDGSGRNSCPSCAGWTDISPIASGFSPKTSRPFWKAHASGRRSARGVPRVVFRLSSHQSENDARDGEVRCSGSSTGGAGRLSIVAIVP